MVSIFERSAWSIILVIGLTHWMSTARMIRSETLSLKGMPFVEATRSLGAGDMYIIFRHQLPNILHTVVVSATLMTARAILTESMLSFPGLGMPPHEPSRGNMLTEAQRDVMRGIWWTTLFPGMMIVLTLLSINHLGNRMKNRLVPSREMKATRRYL